MDDDDDSNDDNEGGGDGERDGTSNHRNQLGKVTLQGNKKAISMPILPKLHKQSLADIKLQVSSPIPCVSKRTRNGGLLICVE